MKLLTDYFQAAELVAAGVPMETADYFFQKDCIYTTSEKEAIEPTFPYKPCWSIAALWEYLHEHNCDMVFTFDTEQSTENLLEGLVNAAIMVRKREDEE